MDGEPKELFEEAKTTASFFEMSGDRAALEMCLNLVIYGNPGTGKTMFSRLYCPDSSGAVKHP
jgi:DNA replication protein DnaC